MSLGDDLHAQVVEIFKREWTKRNGQVVPESADLGLSNDAVAFDAATVLYADISDSTKLVNDYPWNFAAEIYKAFLLCAAKVISDEGGVITAYDGDRVMAVFIGNSKNTSAAQTALKINYCVQNLVNPALKAQYPDRAYQVRHVVGADVSSVRVARTGIRGSNDLVWVGRAANYAAKLCALPDMFPSYITADVYNALADSAKFSDGRPMWEQATWNSMGGFKIYRSTWWWKVS